jgi:hypothetical protein
MRLAGMHNLDQSKIQNTLAIACLNRHHHPERLGTKKVL